MSFWEDARGFYDKLPKGLVVIFLLLILIAALGSSLYSLVNLAQAYFFVVTFPAEHPALFAFVMRYSFHLILAFGLAGLLVIFIWAAFHPVEPVLITASTYPPPDSEAVLPENAEPPPPLCAKLHLKEVINNDEAFIVVQNFGSPAEVHGLIYVETGIPDWPSDEVLALWDNSDRSNVQIATGATKKLMIARKEPRSSYPSYDSSHRWKVSYSWLGEVREASTDKVSSRANAIAVVRVTVLANPPEKAGVSLAVVHLY